MTTSPCSTTRPSMPDQERGRDDGAAHGAPAQLAARERQPRAHARALRRATSRVERHRGEHDDRRLGADAEARDSVGDHGDEDHHPDRRREDPPRATAPREQHRARDRQQREQVVHGHARLLDAQVAPFEERLLARLLPGPEELEGPAQPRGDHDGQPARVLACVAQPLVAQARRRHRLVARPRRPAGSGSPTRRAAAPRRWCRSSPRPAGRRRWWRSPPAGRRRSSSAPATA